MISMELTTEEADLMKNWRRADRKAQEFLIRVTLSLGEQGEQARRAAKKANFRLIPGGRKMEAPDSKLSVG